MQEEITKCFSAMTNEIWKLIYEKWKADPTPGPDTISLTGFCLEILIPDGWLLGTHRGAPTEGRPYSHSSLHHFR